MRAGRRIRARSRKAFAKRKSYRRRRRAGMCTGGCGRPTPGGKAMCPTCRESFTAANRRLVDAHLAASLCRECGWPASRGTKCLTCRTKRKWRPSRRTAARRTSRRAHRSRAAVRVDGVAVSRCCACSCWKPPSRSNATAGHQTIARSRRPAGRYMSSMDAQQSLTPTAPRLSSKHEGYCSGAGCLACAHPRSTGCSDPGCG